jgi:hypothetical protein
MAKPPSLPPVQPDEGKDRITQVAASAHRHHSDLRRGLTGAIEVDRHLQLAVMLLEGSAYRLEACFHASVGGTRLSQEPPREFFATLRHPLSWQTSSAGSLACQGPWGQLWSGRGSWRPPLRPRPPPAGRSPGLPRCHLPALRSADCRIWAAIRSSSNVHSACVRSTSLLAYSFVES